MNNKVSEVRVENWAGSKIRFVLLNGEWWALLNDICVLFSCSIGYLTRSLEDDMVTRVDVDQYNVLARDMDLLNDDTFADCQPFYSTDSGRLYSMLAVNELGLYRILLENHESIEARKLRRWTTTVLQRLRKEAGLEGYEILRMCDSDVQNRVDEILNCLYFDESTRMVMESVTVAGGDVEQVPYMPINEMMSGYEN